jgi:hypothetical protein
MFDSEREDSAAEEGNVCENNLEGSHLRISDTAVPFHVHVL